MRTLLLLNIQGSIFTLFLLLIDRMIQKSFSGKVQRCLWIFAAIVFLLPIWKLVPAYDAKPIILPNYNKDILFFENQEEFLVVEENEAGELVPNKKSFEIKTDLKIWIWVVGINLYLVLNFGSYIFFSLKKKKDSILLRDELFESICDEMNIKRKIRLKKCTDTKSPMLTGVIFPVVYIPDKEMKANERYYIYRHELTHYKHKDLIIKWIICLINAMNWFNPFVYLIIKRLNEACEIYCDEAVTVNMSDNEKKEYMNTILNLVVMR